METLEIFFNEILSPENENTPSTLIVRKLLEKGVIRCSESPKKYKCKYCLDNGVVLEERISPRERYEFQVAVPCPLCRGKSVGNSEKQDFRRAAREAGIPSVHAGKRLQDFNFGAWGRADASIPELKEAMQDCVEHTDRWSEKGRGLFLWSETKGTGKSFCACTLANELLFRGWSVRFVRSADLLNLATDSSRANRGEVTQLERLKTVPVLFLDDLGEKRSGKDFFMDVLFDLLDYRLGENLITVFTSNFRLRDLPYDSWLLDRLNRVCLSIQFPEISVRTLEAQRELADFRKEIHERQTGKREEAVS